MIDHVRKLIFIHIARTGGTSIETALVGKDWWLIDPGTKHISAEMAHRIYGDEIWNTYTKFSVIRNPWDRILSMWATKWWHEASKLDESCSLEQFISKLIPHPNERYNSLFYHEILNKDIDFMLRFETLQSDFSFMLNSIGVSDISLPHVEKRDRPNYRAVFGFREKMIVESLFKVDIMKYCYSY